MVTGENVKLMVESPTVIALEFPRESKFLVDDNGRLSYRAVPNHKTDCSCKRFSFNCTKAYTFLCYPNGTSLSVHIVIYLLSSSRFLFYVYHLLNQHDENLKHNIHVYIYLQC